MIITQELELAAERPSRLLVPRTVLDPILSDKTREFVRQATLLRIAPSPGALTLRQIGPSLEERLFDARAAAKILTATVAMHIPRERRDRLFAKIDALHDPESWEEGDEPLHRDSFDCFLRVLLDLQPTRFPGIGLSFEGNLLAAWIVGEERLYMEFFPGRRVRWSLTHLVGDEAERAAGDTPAPRLRDVLTPYPTSNWFS